MKTLRSCLVLMLLGMILSSCGTRPQTEATPLPESMKGYELYSWQENGQWSFSLLAGTNRQKTLDEIRSNDTTLADVEALIAMLENVPSGQFVTWSSRESLSFPPESVIQKIEKVCQDRGLVLNIAQ
jgi:hypothetical protein